MYEVTERPPALEGGKVVVIEGVNGIGKTTLIKNLMLSGVSSAPISLKEDAAYSSLALELWRMIHRDKTLSPLTRLYLIDAARVEFIHNVLIPIKKEYDLILLDRFFLSTLVYQSLDIPMADCLTISKPSLMPYGYVGLIDGTIYLRGDVETAMQRMDAAKQSEKKHVFDNKRAMEVGDKYDSVMSHANTYDGKGEFGKITRIDGMQSEKQVLMDAECFINALKGEK